MAVEDTNKVLGTIVANDLVDVKQIVLKMPDGETKTFSEGGGGMTTNLTIGTVTTLAPGSNATATLTGTPENPVLNLGIPKGATGPTGPAGANGENVVAPDYVQTEAERVAKLVNKYRNSNSLVFAAMSDSHYGIGNYYDGITHAAQALDIIQNHTPLDAFVHFGDWVIGGSTSTLEGATADYENQNAALALGIRGVPNIRMNGNHDNNKYNYDGLFTADQLYSWIGSWNDRDVVTHYGNVMRNYGYLDFVKQKIRVIYLNTSDQEGITIPAVGTAPEDHRVSPDQFNWFANTALNMTDKPDVNDWSIVIFSHFPVMWYGEPTKIQTIVNAYKAGTSGSISSGGVTVSYNYSGKNAADIIAYFHGHVHCFKVGYLSDTIPRISIPNACAGRENEYGQGGNLTVGEDVTYPKTKNSSKDTAFNIVVIDRENEVINCVNYGAGYDRTVLFDGTVICNYAVTNNLTNATTNNSIASIESGSSYTATITVASGCENLTVKVTMGGTDITSTAYSNGVINIANVTGNIVITATATQQTASTYTITNNLTNATTSNSATSIANGASYTATISATSGYKLSTVTVTMGGVNVTSSAYNNGVITISSVTGNIVITVATVKDGYTNIIDTIGYTDGQRLSTSAGTLKEATGYTTTGFIDLMDYINNTPCVIRTKGVDFRASNNGNCAYVWYTATEAFYSSNYFNAFSNSSMSVEFDDEGNLTMTFISIPNGNPLIRLCGYGSGANLILTVNEEITDDAGGSGDQGGTTTTYTNLVPTSLASGGGSVYNSTGYKEGYRLNSSGTETASTNCICSGFIPYNKQVIRAWGDAANSGITYTGNYISFYDASFAKIGVLAFTTDTSVTYELLNGRYLMTLDPSKMTNATYKGYTQSAAYIRTSFASCTGADFIVTLDEEITF